MTVLPRITNAVHSGLADAKRFLAERRGAAVTLWALALVPLLGLTALGVDVSLWYVYKRDAQSAADASALHAALVMNAGEDSAAIQSAADDAASDNGFAPGSAVTVTVNYPPASGAYAGNDQFVEVVVARDYPNFLLNLFGMGTTNMRARAVAGVVTDPSEFCLLSLSPGGTGVTFTGTTDMIMNCGVAVTSTDSAALSVQGDAYVSVTDICVAGQTSISGHPTFADATPTDGCPPPTDPLAGLSPPPHDVCSCDETNYKVDSNGQTIPLTPGVYCNGIDVSGSNNTLDLAPGVYVIAGGGMSVGGSSNLVQGDGVTIYNTESCAGNDFGDIRFQGATTIILSAPDSGDYAGITFFNDPNPNNTTEFQLAGTVDTDFDGSIYWPNPGSLVDYAGESIQNQSCGMKIIAWEVIYRGTSNLVNPDPSCANNSVPIEGIGPVRLIE